jgi:hypothetical protein
MHPFWSSHKEKCVCVRLSMEAAMAGVGTSLRRRGAAGGGLGGQLGGGAWGALLLRAVLSCS